MRKKPFIPPIPNISSSIDSPKGFRKISKKDIRKFQKSDNFQKYLQPTLEREKKLKKQQRSEWFWTKGVSLLNLLLALIAAITGIIGLIK